MKDISKAKIYVKFYADSKFIEAQLYDPVGSEPRIESNLAFIRDIKSTEDVFAIAAITKIYTLNTLVKEHA